MPRVVSEWQGRTDDHRAPGKVRQRVFDRENGICHLCNQPIQAPGQKWDLDHVVALINGGENRESNLKPAHRDCHKDKTARDVAEKAKIAAVRGKHIGAIQPKQSIQSRGFDRKERHPKPSLPPRLLFKSIEADHDHVSRPKAKPQPDAASSSCDGVMGPRLCPPKRRKHGFLGQPF